MGGQSSVSIESVHACFLSECCMSVLSNIVHLRVLRHHYVYELGLLPMFLRSAVIFKRVALPDWPAKHVCYISRMSEGIWNTGWSVLQIKDRKN